MAELEALAPILPRETLVVDDPELESREEKCLAPASQLKESKDANLKTERLPAFSPTSWRENTSWQENETESHLTALSPDGPSIQSISDGGRKLSSGAAEKQELLSGGRAVVETAGDRHHSRQTESISTFGGSTTNEKLSDNDGECGRDGTDKGINDGSKEAENLGRETSAKHSDQASVAHDEPSHIASGGNARPKLMLRPTQVVLKIWKTAVDSFYARKISGYGDALVCRHPMLFQSLGRLSGPLHLQGICDRLIAACSSFFQILEQAEGVAIDIVIPLRERLSKRLEGIKGALGAGCSSLDLLKLRSLKLRFDESDFYDAFMERLMPLLANAFSFIFGFDDVRSKVGMLVQRQMGTGWRAAVGTFEILQQKAHAASDRMLLPMRVLLAIVTRFCHQITEMKALKAPRLVYLRVEQLIRYYSNFATSASGKAASLLARFL